MTSDEFEKAFDYFLYRQEYDEAESALFAIVRAAFLAGWESAGGKPPKPQKVIELYRCNHNTYIAPDESESDNQ